jgi:integrase
MAKTFTTKFVENIKPSGKRQEIPDSKCAGLYLLLQPSGHRSWCCRYRFNGEQVKLGLGAWPVVSLLDARIAAAKAREQVAKGKDPATAEADAAAKAAEAKLDTVANICAEYMKREGGKLRTLDARESILRRLVCPVIGDRPIDIVKRSEIVRLLDRVEDQNGPRAADATLGVLRTIFHWHEVREDEFRSPIIRGMGRTNTKERARSRILTDDELRAVWAAASATEGPFGALVKFLLLTSARRSEGAAMRWAEVGSDGTWTLPALRSKTKTEIIRPLAKPARVLLAEQPRFDGCDHVFTTNGRTPLAQFSVPKKRLDAASGVTGWRLHDLRRTSRSLLPRAGVNADIAERCLGHAMPTIRATYDRHQYLLEMQRAFDALAALIERIVAGKPDDKIVTLSARR